MIKWLVEAGRNLLVASLQDGTPNHNSVLSFQIVNADCLAIAKALGQIQEMRECPDQYMQETTVSCGNVIIFKFSGPTCSIIVNNCRVVYHGDIDRLKGLSDAIKKSYDKFENSA